MNYAPNERDWKIGDLVIHDCDAKRMDMLMVVVGEMPGGMYKTVYVNQDKHVRHHSTETSAKIWLNEKQELHAPYRFEFWPKDEIVIEPFAKEDFLLMRRAIRLLKVDLKDWLHHKKQNPTPSRKNDLALMADTRKDWKHCIQLEQRLALFNKRKKP